MALITIVETVQGVSNGKIMLKNFLSGEHPSIVAHSSSSIGTDLTKPWYINRANGIPKPQ